jgi:hypothetical protein
VKGDEHYSRLCCQGHSGPPSRDEARLSLPRGHLVSDRKGIPLAVVLTAANTHDSTAFEERVDAIEPVKRPGRGRSRKRPAKLHADKAYDAKKCSQVLRKRGIKSRLARKG